MIVVDGVAGNPGKRVVIVIVVVIAVAAVVDAIGIDNSVAVAVRGNAAAKGLQGRRQRWRAGGGRCRAPEAPARWTGGGYAAGRYRHAGVEWDSTWRALCHAHRRHHSPLHALHRLFSSATPAAGLPFFFLSFFFFRLEDVLLLSFSLPPFSLHFLFSFRSFPFPALIQFSVSNSLTHSAFSHWSFY